MLTYAQNFEDVMLHRLFSVQTEGFYVDVGAWHPVMHSVTKHFYDLGWRGINIEPLPGQLRLFQEARPKDTNLNVAAGERDGQLKFYVCDNNGKLSTADELIADQLRKEGQQIREIEVPVRTLNAILTDAGVYEIDFLKIDSEGWEYQVLRGLDLARIRPRVLLIEATVRSSKISDWSRMQSIRAWDRWETLVLEKGYLFAYYDGLRRFYLREEDAELLRRFSLPPGAHDDIEFPALVNAKWEIDALKEERKTHEEVIERLQNELKAVKADRSLKAEVIERLVVDADRIASLERKLAAKNCILQSVSKEKAKWRGVLGGIFDLSYRYSRRASTPIVKVVPPSRLKSSVSIAIDTLNIVPGVSGGVETYMAMLTRAIIQTGKLNLYVLVLENRLADMQRSFGCEVGYVIYPFSRAIRAVVAVSNLVSKRQKLNLHADLALVDFADLERLCSTRILHSPVQIFSSYEFSIPSVLNLHDLQHLHFPENFSQGDLDARNRLYGLSADLADAIITSSDFVRNDVITKMSVAARKVFTIPVTWNPQVIDGLKKFKSDDAAAQYKLPENFGFYPAQFWPHKNHITLVRALRIVRDRLPNLDFKLVFTGYRGHTGWPQVNQEMDRLRLHDHVVILDHIPVDHLAAIYKRARFCVVPSLFEASSYPVIEAQVLGCPSMCSDVTSLPELMKDGSGLLFDPLSPEDIAEKMERWLVDPKDAAEHAQRGRRRALAENSMESYADKLSEVYDFVLSDGKAIGL